MGGREPTPPKFLYKSDLRWRLGLVLTPRDFHVTISPSANKLLTLPSQQDPLPRVCGKQLIGGNETKKHKYLVRGTRRTVLQLLEQPESAMGVYYTI